MIAIAVDDEALMLGALVAAVNASPDISAVAKFSDCEEALEYVRSNPPDIAFLDINMRGMGGLALAESLPRRTCCPLRKRRTFPNGRHKKSRKRPWHDKKRTI